MESNNHHITQSDCILRPNSIKIWKDSSISKAGSESIGIDTAKLWNNAPPEITNAMTLGLAKSAVKKYCKQLEI